MKITICGSMKFYEQYVKLKNELENLGHEVIVPLPDENYSVHLNIKRKAMEDFNENLKKSDAILVANYDKEDKICHIGINSIMEIGMAFNQGKKIFILNKMPNDCGEELIAIDAVELNGDLNKLKESDLE